MAREIETDRRDDAFWFPYFQLYEAGTSTRAIARRVGLSEAWVRTRLRRLRRMGPAQLADLKEETLKRTHQRIEAEMMLAEADKASRLASTLITLRKAMTAEQQSHEKMIDPTEPKSEPDEARPSEAETEALRQRVRRKYVERALVYRKQLQDFRRELSGIDGHADGRSGLEPERPPDLPPG